MDDEYKKLAYKRAVWLHLLNRMEGELIVEDIEPSTVVVCDELPYVDRVVPQEVLREVAETIRRWVADYGVELTKFTMVRNEDARTPGRVEPAGNNEGGARGAKRKTAAAGKGTGRPARAGRKAG